MTDPLAEQDDASTPLSPEEREALIPSYITLRGELNEAEQANILEADAWAFSRKRDVLDEGFLNTLHKRMYGNVWRWADTYRKTQKNIGIEFYKIPMELRKLLDDCRYWVKNNAYPSDEIGARFHHRLVSIHCYANGNGRHARIAADLLLIAHGRDRFSWGSANLVDAGVTRATYVAALRAAGQERLRPVVRFCQILRKASVRAGHGACDAQMRAGIRSMCRRSERKREAV
jgi:Fic-DOC domain mobile mystery protein B